MLTKNDLQQIRGVVREEVKSEVTSQLKPFRTEVAKQIDGVNTTVRKQLASQDKRFDKKLRKMQNAIIQYHDEYAIYLRERIEKLEEHTGLAKPNKN